MEPTHPGSPRWSTPEIRSFEAFFVVPTHRVIGIVDAEADADRLVAGLDALGLGKDVWVHSGHAATETLAPHGAEHGVFAKRVRGLQQMGYESAQLVEYDDAASAGTWVIGVSSSRAGPNATPCATSFGATEVGTSDTSRPSVSRICT